MIHWILSPFVHVISMAFGALVLPVLIVQVLRGLKPSHDIRTLRRRTEELCKPRVPTPRPRPQRQQRRAPRTTHKREARTTQRPTRPPQPPSWWTSEEQPTRQQPLVSSTPPRVREQEPLKAEVRVKRISIKEEPQIIDAEFRVVEAPREIETPRFLMITNGGSHMRD